MPKVKQNAIPFESIEPEKVVAITNLIIKFKTFMRSHEMSYSDKVATVRNISSAVIKLVNKYPIDRTVVVDIQNEILPSLLSMKTEKSIDYTFNLILAYLEKVLKLLRK